LMPFVINELTLAANPLKLREYLAAGLPVVSSAIPEAAKLQNVLSIARNHGEFLSAIQHFIDCGITGPQLSISKQMECESWDAKVDELTRILAQLDRTKAAA
jgi:hypothetical protein